MRRGRGEEERSVVQRARREEFYVDVGEIHHPPFFFITEGKQGPHDHGLIITSMEGRCELGGMCRRRKKKTRGVKRRKKCIPESPTGAEYVVPPVSLDEGPESGESNRRRETVN